MLDFRQITLFCFGYLLLKHKMTIFSENFRGGHGPLGLPGLRLCFCSIYKALVTVLTVSNQNICVTIRELRTVRT